LDHREEADVRNTVFALALLTLVWSVLREDFTLPTVFTGLAIGGACIWFCHKFIPLPKTSGIRYSRLVIYYFYLIFQVYLAGIGVIRLLITGAGVDIVRVNTRIGNVLLRTILVNSITLIPGSVSLELEGDLITVLWLTKRGAPPPSGLPPEQKLLVKLERVLGKAEG
jgi:multicomponent Na+:H+ antiporter subunit E